ncbi:hypothetical protein AVEN_265269-1 [Araneus ventricosus]|uniref:DUF5641 domain-containing protein n=1 Tax=Araneus ventricosus TaxID=182803 RepID=A0A4Y2W948_ARAVE|nr:hypothetical protein AVEN_265269-1 [Araneus ventricosus]
MKKSLGRPLTEKKWKRWCEELPLLENIKIPRLVLDSTLDEDIVDLHSFCDANKKVYSAAIYLKSRTRNGISVKLVTSKNRVAPLNGVTLPRLELLGALIAARLTSKVGKIVNSKRSCVKYHWTDSKIVIFWIKGSKTLWKQFVANRVNEIISLTDPNSWYHCAGRPISSIPEPFLTDINENRLSRGQKTTKVVQLIWKKWKSDYLNTLQARSKWMAEKDDLMIGQMVLIKDDFLPINTWLLGRILEVYYESDGKVRVVKVRTKSGNFKRTINKIAVLPIDTS